MANSATRIDPSLADARARALAQVAEQLSARRPTPPATIPIDAWQWSTVVDDSNVRDQFLAAVRATRAFVESDPNDRSAIGQGLRQLATNAWREQLEFDRLGRLVAWFLPPPECLSHRSAVIEAVAATGRVLGTYVATLSSSGGGAQGPFLDQLDALVPIPASPPATRSSEANIHPALGTSVGAFVSARNVIEGSRIEASYFGRKDEEKSLRDRLSRPLIDAAGADPQLRLGVLASLALTDRPYVCLAVAIGTIRIMSDAWRTNPGRVQSVIMESGEIAKYGAFTHFSGLAPATKAFETALTAEARGRAALDVHRIASEGPLRRTAWSILQLLGASGSGPPLLAETYDRLNAAGSPLTTFIASGIHRAWRNASAHEDAYWDGSAGMVITGGAPVSPDELVRAADFYVAAMEGFEIGVFCARGIHADLRARTLNAAAEQITPYADFTLRHDFARAGVPVWDTEWSDGDHKVVVTVDVLNEFRTFFRAMDAILRSHLDLTNVRQFSVRDRDGEHTFRVSSASLAEVDLLRPPLGATELDASVLIPFAVEALLGVAPKEVVALDATRLAVRSPLVVAFQLGPRLMAGDPIAAFRLSDSTLIAGRAIDAAWRLAGSNGAGARALRRALSDVTSVVPLAALDGGGPRTLERAIGRLLDAYHATPQALDITQDAPPLPRTLRGP